MPRFSRLVRSLPDTRLVARVRAGDEAAFEAVYERYHRQLLAFCRHMLGNREEAEDALQHVFVAAHSHLRRPGDQPVVELRPWLYAIARNRCLSVLRARRESLALDDVPEPSGDGLAVAREVEQRQDLQEVLGDLARLPDDQRAALVLAELGDLSHDEVGAVLGVRRDKVKALVFQARESLAGWRQARNADCREIREQLANLRGGGLRRAPLRKHLDVCEACRDFSGEVRRQREAMALLLPVVPGIALKAKVFGAVAASGAAAPVAGVGAAAGVGTAVGAQAAGGALGAAGGGIAAKALVVAAIAGTAGGGYAVVQEVAPPERPRPAVRVIAPTAPPPPAAERRGAASDAAKPAGSGTADRSSRGGRRDNDRRAGAAKGSDGAGRGRAPFPGARGVERAPKSPGIPRRPAIRPGRSGPAAPAERRSPNARGKANGHNPSAPARSTPPPRPQPAAPVKPAKPVSPAPPRQATPPPVAEPEAAAPTAQPEPAPGASRGAAAARPLPDLR